jgi:hypothetical protein
MNFLLQRKPVFLFLCACALAMPAHAQSTSEDPVDTARVHVGPLGLTPTLALTNLGVDSNVFNTFEDPKKDFTFTISPGADLFFRAGPSRLSVISRADLVYFKQYSTERSLDGDFDGRWEINWNRLTPWVAGGYTSGRQRFGYEIDARTRREVKDYAAGVELRVASKTRIAANAQRTTYWYEPDAVFSGSRLQDALNRETEIYGIQYRQALTVLTTLVVRGETTRDTFEFSPERDAEGLRVVAGFDFDDRALLGGRARVGYRRYTNASGAVPDFSGLVASYGVAMTVAGRTRLEVSGERDLTHSYQLDYPYYVLTGVMLTGTPRLTDKWDLQGRVGIQRLAYETYVGASVDANVDDIRPDRNDTYRTFGGGIGFHAGRDIRIGLNVDRQRRTSPLRARDYEGYRIGTSITYGR